MKTPILLASGFPHFHSGGMGILLLLLVTVGIIGAIAYTSSGDTKK
jgi:hypothetical protein